MLFTAQTLMRNETIQALREAAAAALQKQDDQTALELLLMAVGTEKTPAALPQAVAPSPLLLAAPAATPHGIRDYHFWVSFIETQYIPHLKSKNHDSFTSAQCLTWVESCPNVEFSAEEQDSGLTGRPKWKSQVGNALSRLVELGALSKNFGSKVYNLESAGNAKILVPQF